MQWFKYKIWGPGTVSSLGAPDHCRGPMPVVKVSRKPGTHLLAFLGALELRPEAFRLTLTTVPMDNLLIFVSCMFVKNSELRKWANLLVFPYSTTLTVRRKVRRIGTLTHSFWLTGCSLILHWRQWGRWSTENTPSAEIGAGGVLSLF
jgi:hypothetical protein